MESRMPRRPLVQRVAHKSTGGMRSAIPPPVDPVGNPACLISNTVASLRSATVLEIKCERRIPGALVAEHGIEDDE